MKLFKKTNKAKKTYLQRSCLITLLHIKNIIVYRTLSTSEWIFTLCPNCFVISLRDIAPFLLILLKISTVSPVKKGLKTLGKSSSIPTPLSAISSYTVYLPYASFHFIFSLLPG